MAVMTKEEFAQHVKSDTLPMYRLAYSILQNSADAEDAVSEAIVHAYEKLDTLKKLADYFGITIDELIYKDLEKNVSVTGIK